MAVLRPEASQHEMKQTNVLPCEAASLCISSELESRCLRRCDALQLLRVDGAATRSSRRAKLPRFEMLLLLLRTDGPGPVLLRRDL